MLIKVPNYPHIIRWPANGTKAQNARNWPINEFGHYGSSGLAPGPAPGSFGLTGVPTPPAPGNLGGACIDGIYCHKRLQCKNNTCVWQQPITGVPTPPAPGTSGR